MQKNDYKIDNSVERMYRGESTLFLDKKEFMDIKHKLKGIKYNVYSPYKESDKIILYTKETPKINILMIDTQDELRHQSIMGSLYSLGINMSYIGDIVKYHDVFYIYVIDDLTDYLVNNLEFIGHNKVSLKMVDNNVLDGYERIYERISLIESSVRIDAVVSSLAKLSRSQAQVLFKDKAILLNDDICLNNNYNLKENDTFSIRRIGKFVFRGISKKTSKNKLLLEIDKYI